VLRFLFFLFFIGIYAGAQAQILDDSTKVVYGPNTTKYIKEDNILYNDLTFTVIDTSSVNVHRWSKVEKEEYKVMDLGVSGTAVRSIYYGIPYLIGARSGYSAYVPYYKSIHDFKYYDTKSPYSRIGAAIGGKNRTQVDVGFNRSDSSNFNIGIDYSNTNSDKQVSSKGKNDRLVRNEGFDIYLAYFTPNRDYLVMANFSRMKTNAIEQGGIDTLNSEFGYFADEASVFLNNANTEYVKRTYHLYHQYRVNEGFQVYQVFDRSFDRNKFLIEPKSEDINYFDSTYINTGETNDSTIFETISLENGIKGTLGPLFYSAHYRYRIYTFLYGAGELDTLDFRKTKPAQDGIEHYIGGRIRYDFSPEYQLYGGIDFNLNGNQKLWGKVKFKGLEGDFVTQQYEPAYMERAYLGNHDYWINDFKTIKALQIDGSYTHSFKDNSFIKPKATFTSYTDYVYYNKKAVPAQLEGTSTILTLGAKFLLHPTKRLYIEGEGLYSTVGGDSTQVFPIPKIMANLNIYLHGINFGGNLDWQVGIDNHWKSDYFAPDYRVSTNQFFIQDYFNVEAFLISDFYINVKLGHAFVFLKVNNLVDAFTKETYFAAPNYVGKRFRVDYGFYWMFFD
jgi:putative beta-barrel porin